MKIAQVTPAYPPYGGGMGKVVQETSFGLEQLNHEVTVFTPDYEDRTITDDRVNSLDPRLPLESVISKVVSIDNAAPLPQLSRRLDQFDLVHLHYPFFGTDRVVYKYKQENQNIPLVVTYHMDPIAPGLKGVIFKMYRYFYQRRILDSADKIIASTFDYIKHSFANRHFHSDRERWAEIPFGVDLDKFKPTAPKGDFYNTYGLDPDKKTALFVGGMDKAHEFKGVPLLLEAAEQLKDKQNTQLVLVGEGGLKSKYKQMADSLNINDIVNFIGYVEAERLPEFYSIADVFVLPSTDRNEAFGLVLLEAMACDTSVIASDLPGVETVAGQAGTTFKNGDKHDLADKINQVLDGSDISSKSSREQIKNDSWSSRAKKIDKIYSELI